MKQIKTYKWSELFENENIEIPDIQRILDIKKVDEIVKYQTDYYMKNNEYIFFGVITICENRDKKYLIDGQHRYFSMKKLYENYKRDSSCNIEIISVNSLEQVNEYYEIINKNTLLPNFKFTKQEKTVLNNVCKHFQLKYPNIWSSSQRSRRPHIYFNSFQESISFIREKMNIDDPDKLINIIEEKNKSYENSSKESFKNVNDNMINKANEWGFYLGLFTFDINEEYGFIWAKNIVEYYLNIKIKKSSVNRKKTISKSLKFSIWNKYIGKNVGEVHCIVCMINKINMMNFECGHIIPESKGGETSIDNLLPICGLCNKSMGTQNMDDYVKKDFQHNYSGFLSRKYFSTKEKPKNIFNKLF